MKKVSEMMSRRERQSAHIRLLIGSRPSKTPIFFFEITADLLRACNMRQRLPAGHWRAPSHGESP
jgi:hypothetical protein